MTDKLSQLEKEIKDCQLQVLNLLKEDGETDKLKELSVKVDSIILEYIKAIKGG